MNLNQNAASNSSTNQIQNFPLGLGCKWVPHIWRTQCAFHIKDNLQQLLISQFVMSGCWWAVVRQNLSHNIHLILFYSNVNLPLIPYSHCLLSTQCFVCKLILVMNTAHLMPNNQSIIITLFNGVNKCLNFAPK